MSTAKELIAAAKVVDQVAFAIINRQAGNAAQILANHVTETVREDDDEPTTTDWLVSVGFTLYDPWPGIETAAKEWMDWRAAGMWIDQTPIAMTATRGAVRRLCAALGIELK